MKKKVFTNLKLMFVIIALGLMSVNAINAQTTYSWTGGSSTWNTPANWTPARNTPAIDDILQFNGGGVIIVTAVPTETIGELLVSGNTDVTLQTGVANLLTINGGAGTDLDVAVGSALNISGSLALTVFVATGATGSISGNMTFSGAAHKLNAADASAITFNSGAIFTQGALCTGNVFTNTGTANVIVFASGSTFIFTTGGNPFGLAQPNSKVVFQTGSLYKHIATTAPSFSGRTYADFELDNAAANITASGTSKNSIDNLTITNGILNYNLSATPGHCIKGNIVVNGTLNFNPSTAGTVNLNGTSTQTISGSGTLTSGTNSTIVVDNTVVLDMDAALTGALTINATRTFSVNPLRGLTTNGTVTNDGTITLESDATGTGSFIDNGTTAGTGSYVMENYLTGSGGATPNGRFWYVGSPVASALSGIFNAMGDNRLWYWTETTALYSEIITNGISMNPMQGFVARLGATETVNFTVGNFNTGTVGSLDNLTRTATGTYDGYNLVSNPYPSAVLFDITGTGLTRTNIGNTIWYRSSGVYPTYNFSDGTTANGGQAFIPAMQAFWVNVGSGTNGTLIFDNTSRQHNTQAFYKETSEPNIFRLEVSNGTYADETVVTFFSDALAGTEDHDSYKMFVTDEDVAQIYTLTSDSKKVIINGQPELGIGEERILHLGLTTINAGSFTLNATNLDEFDATVPVYLEDATEGVTIDLRQTNTYSFTSGVVDNADRFVLHFGGITTDISSPEILSVYAYAFNHTVYVNTPNENSLIEVYDVLGNLLISKISASGLNEISMDASKGIYIVKIDNGTEIQTEKIMID